MIKLRKWWKWVLGAILALGALVWALVLRTQSDRRRRRIREADKASGRAESASERALDGVARLLGEAEAFDALDQAADEAAEDAAYSAGARAMNAGEGDDDPDGDVPGGRRGSVLVPCWLILFGASMLAPGRLGACPTAAYAAEHRQFQISMGCPVPIDGARLYTLEGHRVVVARFAALDVQLDELDEELVRVRRDRDRIMAEAIDELEVLGAELADAGEELEKTADALERAHRAQPSRLVWGGGGALAGALAVGVTWVLVSL